MLRNVVKNRYRMHPMIAQFPARQFYESELANGITEKDRAVAAPRPRAITI